MDPPPQEKILRNYELSLFLCAELVDVQNKVLLAKSRDNRYGTGNNKQIFENFFKNWKMIINKI